MQLGQSAAREEDMKRKAAAADQKAAEVYQQMQATYTSLHAAVAVQQHLEHQIAMIKMAHGVSTISCEPNVFPHLCLYMH